VPLTLPRVAGAAERLHVAECQAGLPASRGVDVVYGEVVRRAAPGAPRLQCDCGCSELAPLTPVTALGGLPAPRVPPRPTGRAPAPLRASTAVQTPARQSHPITCTGSG
jgi:hypothetical protein